jgi:hypothetical protein
MGRLIGKEFLFMSPQFVRYSKFLRLALCHKPEKIGLQLDAQGWVDVEELLAKAKVYGVVLTRPQLEQIIVTNDKQRFAFSPDGQCILASQGHLSWPMSHAGLPVCSWNKQWHRLRGYIGFACGRETHRQIFEKIVFQKTASPTQRGSSFCPTQELSRPDTQDIHLEHGR